MTDHLFDEIKALRTELQKANEAKRAAEDKLVAAVATFLRVIQTNAPPALATLMLAQVPEEQHHHSKLVDEHKQLREIVRDLVASCDAGCGCDTHPPYACEWHGPLLKARQLLSHIS